MYLVWFRISERKAGDRHMQRLGVRILVTFMGEVKDGKQNPWRHVAFKLSGAETISDGLQKLHLLGKCRLVK